MDWKGSVADNHTHKVSIILQLWDTLGPCTTTGIQLCNTTVADPLDKATCSLFQNTSDQLELPNQALHDPLHRYT